MVDKRVRSELLDKLHVTPQALSKRAKSFKNKYGPMSTDEAVYVIAHNEGIDLSKYLSLHIIDRIRSLVPRQIYIQQIGQQQKSRKNQKNKLKTVPYPFVKPILIKKAKEIGEETFPFLFIIENSIRELIVRTLSRKKNNWWDEFVPNMIKKSVKRTADKEKKFPYREKRGNQPILYCNFSDLKEIILANQNDFKNIIFDFEWFEIKMDEIYMVRNNIAHSIPLTKDDISRVSLFYRDWARLMETSNITL